MTTRCVEEHNYTVSGASGLRANGLPALCTGVQPPHWKSRGPATSLKIPVQPPHWKSRLTPFLSNRNTAYGRVFTGPQPGCISLRLTCKLTHRHIMQSFQCLATIHPAILQSYLSKLVHLWLCRGTSTPACVEVPGAHHIGVCHAHADSCLPPHAVQCLLLVGDHLDGHKLPRRDNGATIHATEGASAKQLPCTTE